MTENRDESVLDHKIQILAEEAAFIRERHSAAPKGPYRDQLEARYAELGNEIQTLKKKATMPLIGEPTSKSDSGPFGIAFGMPVEKLDVDMEVKLSPGMYVLKTVPKPHSSFELVLVQASKSYGVCWIKAVGRDISTGANGISLQVKFDEMAGRLEKIYGSPTQSADYLDPESCWNESLDWMMGLMKEERHLNKLWDVTKGASLPSGFASVFLVACARSTETGYIAIEYSGTNAKACDEELAAEEDGSL